MRIALAAAVLLLVGLVWHIPAATTSPTATGSWLRTDAAPTPGKDPLPGSGTGQTLNACKPGILGVRWGSDRGEALKDYEPGDFICARGGDDKITVRYLGTKVYAGPGNDKIYARQPKNAQIANEIKAGEGQDNATVDRWDSWESVESLRTTNSVGRSDSHTASSQTAPRYPAWQPRIQCTIVNAERRLMIDPAPEIRAVDSSATVDWQFVAWSPVLNLYNTQSQKYEFVVQNEWLWDRTYDLQVTKFAGNVWRRFTQQGEEWHLWFTAHLTQVFYKIAVYYYHYPEGNIPANRVYAWVDEYTGEFAAGDGKSCYFTQ